jgi:hypothetical protein
MEMRIQEHPEVDPKDLQIILLPVRIMRNCGKEVIPLVDDAK